MISVSEMISTEFSNAPVATFIAVLSLAGAAFKLIIAFKNKVIKNKEEDNKTFERAGIPSFLLRFFMISLSTKKTPETKKLDKAMIYILLLLFIGSLFFSAPILIRITKTPQDHTLLIWKATGDFFYISRTQASESTLFSHSGWQVKKSDCQASNAPVVNQQNLPSPDIVKGVCDMFNTPEGQEYLAHSLKTYPKGKQFAWVMLPFTELVLLWMAAGCALHLYYAAKLRKYIVSEQDKAVSYVR